MPKASNGPGSLADTLYYRFSGIELNDGTLTAKVPGAEEGEGDTPADAEQPGTIAVKTVPVQVRIIKKYGMDSKGEKRPAKSVQLQLKCDNPRFEITGTDIEALRKAAWDHLDAALAVKWEPYYLIHLAPSTTTFRGKSSGLAFVYTDVERGTAHDGTLLLRSYEWGGNLKIEPWPGEFKDQHGKLMACIPATEKNRQALEEFSSMINHLRQRLADFFRPDQIMQTLARLGEINMLVGPPSSPETPATNQQETTK